MVDASMFGESISELNNFLILVLQVRKTWCNDALNKAEDFRNVIFADESTVEMSSSGRLFFHQPSSLIQKMCARRPKPKHAYKVCTQIKCFLNLIHV